MSRTILQGAMERRFPGAQIDLLPHMDAFRVTRIVDYKEIAALNSEEKVRWVWRSLEPAPRPQRPHWSLLGRRRRP